MLSRKYFQPCDHYSRVHAGWLSSRQVLWIMVFIGFAVNYMVRINMNIALVAMVEPPRRLALAEPSGNGSAATARTAVGTQCFLPEAVEAPEALGRTALGAALLNGTAEAEDDEPVSTIYVSGIKLVNVWGLCPRRAEIEIEPCSVAKPSASCLLSCTFARSQ